MAVLEIKHLTKIYKGNKKAVDDFSLTVEAGDIYGFIGHNGAGKTTTIKAIAGILDFNEGDVIINGHSIKTNPIDCKRDLAYIPDNPDLYEHLTGIQYLNFIADVFDIDASTRKAQIHKYAQAFDLSPALGNLISSYSHGMKQKLALISGLIHSPRLLLLDEPFVGLDPEASITLKKIMHELCDNGSAIFFSTHILDVAEKLCNKVAIIKNGRLLESGDMDKLIKNQSLESLYIEVEDNEK
jgi:ABC-2 type transport system ATP-binding protein